MASDDSTTKVLAGLIAGIGLIAGMVVLIAAAALWEAFVLLRLWQWFVVPTFSLAPLTYPAAIGLGLIVEMLTASTTLYKEHTTDPVPTLVRTFAVQAGALLTGWIVTLFQ